MSTRHELIFLLAFPSVLVSLVGIGDVLTGRPIDLGNYAYGFGLGFLFALVGLLLLALPRMSRAHAHRPLFEPLQDALKLRKRPGSLTSAPGLHGQANGAEVIIEDSLGKQGRTPSLRIRIRGPVTRPVFFKRRTGDIVMTSMPPAHDPLPAGQWSLWGIARGAGSRDLQGVLDALNYLDISGATKDGTLEVQRFVNLSGMQPETLEAHVRQLLDLHAAAVQAAKEPADPEEQAAARRVRADLGRLLDRT